MVNGFEKNEDIGARLVRLFEDPTIGEDFDNRVYEELKKEYPKLSAGDLRIVDMKGSPLIFNVSFGFRTGFVNVLETLAGNEFTPLLLACVHEGAKKGNVSFMNIKSVVKLCELLDEKSSRFPPTERDISILLDWANRNGVIGPEPVREASSAAKEIEIKFWTTTAKSNKITLSRIVDGNPIRFYAKAIHSTGKLPGIQSVMKWQEQQLEEMVR